MIAMMDARSIREAFAALDYNQASEQLTKLLDAGSIDLEDPETADIVIGEMRSKLLAAERDLTATFLDAMTTALCGYQGARLSMERARLRMDELQAAAAAKRACAIAQALSQRGSSPMN